MEVNPLQTFVQHGIMVGIDVLCKLMVDVLLELRSVYLDFN